ncbi:hypothetical protein HYH03_000882 [Edaphochlamys debaryana]|uniref:Pre-rRNA-processing protein Ipi1 N-terminal domain-containing protein n=1 Tax=Edaphochlamys debaryana TaxID=47281 RepID=A0A835YE65_9CHLO|nr:hypothetical protein HYH03_000882 [Edaphochlamys debaryana]|eukprot:KAG2501063.1 hypothetical protein HYH03_000882 [Edaphochlamys debaryana]
MGKPTKSKKTRNPGVGVDFKRVKHKVGKKLPKAQNETNTDYTSKSIHLPSQAVREDRSGVATNYQNLTLKELLSQTSHHNDKARKHSLEGLADLFARHPDQLRLHAAQVIGTLAERVVDGEPGVRSQLRSLLGGSVLPLLGPDALRPFMPVLMSHVCGAMTHLSLDVRNDALLFLDCLMDHAPRLVLDGFLAPCLAHFCDLFAAPHRGRSIRSQSMAALTKLLTALDSFLRRAFPEARSGGGGGGGSGGSGGGEAMEAEGAGAGGAAAEGAGPGPSSLRQAAAAAAAALGGLGVVGSGVWRGAPLGADRGRRPTKGPAELMAALEEQFKAAAAATRSAKARAKGGAGGGGGGGGGGGVSADKGRGKKGRGSVSMSESATSSHLVGSTGGGGGKGVAAAAAALAAVAAAAGDASAGPDAAAVPAPATTMAAALAAASDVRASALRLLGLLMDAWLECDPGKVSSAPDLECVTALGTIAAAANTLIDRILLPPSADGAAAVAAAAGLAPPSPLPPAQLALAAQLHDLVGRRVAATFPATLPPVKPSAAAAEALVRLNLESSELLCRFLPLAAAQAAAAAAAAAPPPEAALPWIPTLVAYYVGVLEGGVLLPEAAHTLSDAVGAPTGAAALPAGASDALLAAVAAAVTSLDGGGAQRLMAAVAAFAERQPPRSAARVAAIRMQHGLLRAALAGRLFLEDGVVSGWLAPLPKLLWEAGGGAPEASAAALALLMDAARFAAPGSTMATFLGATLQPQLAPLFGTQLPPKAAKAALKAAAAGAGGGGAEGCGSDDPGVPAAAAAGAEGVLVVLPGVVGKLPAGVGAVAIDLLYHTGPPGAALLKPLAAALSSSALPAPLALRLLDVTLSRLAAGGSDAALAASWLLSVLFGPQHGQRVLAPDGSDLTAGWARRKAVVDGVTLALGGLGGPGALLTVLAPQLAALPLAEGGSVGGGAARVQRYSLVRLAEAALAEAGRGGGPGVPKALAATLPAAAALCGVELAAAAAAGGDEAAATAALAPVLQLLSQQPSLAVGVVRQLTELLGKYAAGGSAAAAATGQGRESAVGRVPLHAAALAALRLAAAAVRLPAVRSALAAAAAEREAVVAAAGGLVAAVRALPAAAAAGPVAAENAAACGVEGQRLTQTVADLYGARTQA